MLGFIFWRVRLYKEKDFLRFVKYFIFTGSNPMGYTFTKDAEINLDKVIRRLGSSGNISFVVNKDDRDFRALCKRNGITLNANRLFVKTKFVSVDVLNLYKQFKLGHFGDINLDDYNSGSALGIYNNEFINVYNVVKVREII